MNPWPALPLVLSTMLPASRDRYTMFRPAPADAPRGQPGYAYTQACEIARMCRIRIRGTVKEFLSFR